MKIQNFLSLRPFLLAAMIPATAVGQSQASPTRHKLFESSSIRCSQMAKCKRKSISSKAPKSKRHQVRLQLSCRLCTSTKWLHSSRGTPRAPPRRMLEVYSQVSGVL